jgi:predicted nucleic acid-binding protein
MATASSSTDVCIDTCVFVNFAIVGRVDVIAKISGFLFHVPQEVVDEVTVARQRQLLDEMLASGDLKKTEVHDVSELARFAEYSQRFGRGESACLAIAACRGWVFATDESKDKRLKKEIESSKVRIINTPGLILKAIQDGVLSISEADAIKAELEKNRFKMDFGSFQEFAGRPSA